MLQTKDEVSVFTCIGDVINADMITKENIMHAPRVYRAGEVF